MNLFWKRLAPLALAILVGMTGWASAQDRKDFKTPLPDKRGPAPTARPEAGRGPGGPDMSGLQSQLDRLKQSLADLSRQLDKLRTNDRAGAPGPKGPPQVARASMPERFGPPPGKGGPPGPPSGFGRPNFGPPPGGPGGPGRGPSGDLEGRVSRLERSVEELRREVRGHR